MEHTEVRARIAAVESLLAQVDGLDETSRAVATDTVQCLLELYGEALARMLGAIEAEAADGVRERLVVDDLVAHLLCVHGLHPVPVETRIVDALEGVRPYLESHGGGVELLRVADEVAYLRLEGSCSGCPSSAVTLRLAVEEAVLKAAPEVERIEAEGAVAPARPQIPLAVLSGTPASPSPDAGAWAVAGGLPQLAGGGTLVREVAGEEILFVRLDDGSYHAHRPTCPGCGGSLDGSRLEGSEVTCDGCGQRYDVRRAGRCLDAPDTYLEPFPLLVGEAGLVKVAVGAASR